MQRFVSVPGLYEFVHMCISVCIWEWLHFPITGVCVCVCVCARVRFMRVEMGTLGNLSVQFVGEWGGYLGKSPHELLP